VHAVRALLSQRHLAALICAAALLVKLMIPAGYMLSNEGGRLAIVICPSASPAPMPFAMAGMHGDMGGHGAMAAHDDTQHRKPTKDHGKAEAPCVFSSLSAAALASIDPVQLAALIVFILALGWVAVGRVAPPIPAHLRPPLRGPPAFL